MMNREKQKKEQKTFEYIENPEQIEGFDKIPVPEDLDQRVRAGIEEGKKRRKKIAFRKTAKVGMGMAAAVALASVLCISNPSFAAKMPLIGHIFYCFVRFLICCVFCGLCQSFCNLTEISFYAGVVFLLFKNVTDQWHFCCKRWIGNT